jgi:hypothetical protein
MERTGRGLGDTAFTLAFCLWVLTAAAGLFLTVSSALALMGPPPEIHDSWAPPPVDRARAARAFGAGVLLMAWPLAFYRKSNAPILVPGFGRVPPGRGEEP